MAAIAAAALGWGLTVATAACSRAPGNPNDRAADKPGVARSDSEGLEVSNLPFARGRTFGSLDDYLEHLERQGAIDLPYWREIRPGLYEHVTTRQPRGEPERATRSELMERFGFTR
jgi:hypothetical protein